MGKKQYLGGHTLLGPGSSWFGWKKPRSNERTAFLQSIAHQLATGRKMKVNLDHASYQLWREVSASGGPNAWAAGQPELPALVTTEKVRVAKRERRAMKRANGQG